MNNLQRRFVFHVEMSLDTPIQYLQSNQFLAVSENHYSDFLLTVAAKDLDDAYNQAKDCMNETYSCQHQIRFIKEVMG